MASNNTQSENSSRIPENQEVPPKKKRRAFGGLIQRIVGERRAPSMQTSIKELIQHSDVPEEAPVSAHERKLLTNILKLRDIRADQVMIPRADIVAMDIDTSPADLMNLLAEKQFSRIPVFRNTLDEVVGTIHIKDIISCIARREEIHIRNHITDIPIVSPSLPIIDLLQIMQKSKRHIVLIVDEYGGIDGLVTIGDIIESIVGEIDDEHENDDEPKIMEREDGSIIADGRFDATQFVNLYGPIISEEELEANDTLGGLVCSIAGRVPARGEVLTHSSGIVFEILDADPRRVNSLRIKNIPTTEI